MSDEKETRRTLMEAAESVAKAAWMVVRASADFHVELFGKVRDMADGAISKLSRRDHD